MLKIPHSFTQSLTAGFDWLAEKAVAPLDRMELTALQAQQARDRQELTQLGYSFAQPHTTPLVLVIPGERVSFASQIGLPISRLRVEKPNFSV